ncbi:PqiC family protein [Roseateles koreensis]|uniref:PqiC family protein n=1 Tax=Roseateles koreensis TaxID=2987526 RepID=A0ABT5KSS9_9BURK|nr:PqiC family protein [Roseateles koreensis]MDC8785881.1 PqiC family protein [Roseateles koreensis]
MPLPLLIRPILVLPLLLAACASEVPAPRTLALQAIPGKLPAAAGAASAAMAPNPASVDVVVDRVILPDLIKRNTLLERIAPGEVVYHDAARWAEPLSEALPRVLADDLSTRLSRSVGLNKLRPLSNTAAPAWLLWVDVRRLEVDPQGQVTLVALWTWQREGTSNTHWQQGHFTATASSRDPERVAYAHSQVLSEFAQAIATGFAQGIWAAP